MSKCKGNDASCKNLSSCDFFGILLGFFSSYHLVKATKVYSMYMLYNYNLISIILFKKWKQIVHRSVRIHLKGMKKMKLPLNFSNLISHYEFLLTALPRRICVFDTV